MILRSNKKIIPTKDSSVTCHSLMKKVEPLSAMKEKGKTVIKVGREKYIVETAGTSENSKQTLSCATSSTLQPMYACGICPKVHSASSKTRVPNVIRHLASHIRQTRSLTRGWKAYKVCKDCGKCDKPGGAHKCSLKCIYCNQDTTLMSDIKSHFNDHHQDDNLRFLMLPLPESLMREEEIVKNAIEKFVKHGDSTYINNWETDYQNIMIRCQAHKEAIRVNRVRQDISSSKSYTFKCPLCDSYHKFNSASIVAEHLASHRRESLKGIRCCLLCGQHGSLINGKDDHTCACCFCCGESVKNIPDLVKHRAEFHAEFEAQHSFKLPPQQILHEFALLEESINEFVKGNEKPLNEWNSAESKLRMLTKNKRDIGIINAISTAAKTNVWRCHLCPKFFKTGSDTMFMLHLEMHRASLLGVSPRYVCGTCKGFIRGKNHRCKACEICGETFLNINDLKEHMYDHDKLEEERFCVLELPLSLKKHVELLDRAIQANEEGNCKPLQWWKPLNVTTIRMPNVISDTSYTTSTAPVSELEPVNASKETIPETINLKRAPANDVMPSTKAKIQVLDLNNRKKGNYQRHAFKATWLASDIICVHCWNFASDWKKLMNHVDTSHKDCKRCTKIYGIKNKKRYNINVKQLIFCKICNIQYKRPKSYEKHWNLHHCLDKKNIYEVCKLCDESIYSKYINEHSVHCKVFRSKYKYQCKQCSRKFRYLHSLTIHVAKDHKKITTKVAFICFHCKTNFNSEIELLECEVNCANENGLEIPAR